MREQDLFRNRLEQLLDMKHPLVLLSAQMDWESLERRLSPLLAHADRGGIVGVSEDWWGKRLQIARAGVSPAGRERKPLRRMAGLLYLKHAYDLSDENLVERWRENPYWQYFCGEEFFQTELPCDATTVMRFRKVLGEAGVEELLAQTINVAVSMRAIKVEELERVLVDTTVQEKAIAFPTDSRLLEIARRKVVLYAKLARISLKQTFEKEGQGRHCCHRSRRANRWGTLLPRQSL